MGRRIGFFFVFMLISSDSFSRFEIIRSEDAFQERAARDIAEREYAERKETNKKTASEKERLALERMKSQRLLYTSAQMPVRMTGDCLKDEVVASSLPIKLGDVLSLYMPKGWVIYGHEGIKYESLNVMLKNREPLVDVFKRMGQAHNLSFEINCLSSSMQISLMGDRGMLANSKAITPSEQLITQKTGVMLPVSDSAPNANYHAVFHKGESLREFMERVHKDMGFTKTVVDFSPGSIDPIEVFSTGDAIISAENLASFSSLVNSMLDKPYESLSLIAVEDAEGSLLVATDQIFYSTDNVRVFKVQRGRVFENAKRLSDYYSGWHVPDGAWRVNKQYIIPFAYYIVVGSELHAFDRLFRRYPVKAQLIQGEGSIVFVPRNIRIGEQP